MVPNPVSQYIAEPLRFQTLIERSYGKLYFIKIFEVPRIRHFSLHLSVSNLGTHLAKTRDIDKLSERILCTLYTDDLLMSTMSTVSLTILQRSALMMSDTCWTTDWLILTGLPLLLHYSAFYPFE